MRKLILAAMGVCLAMGLMMTTSAQATQYTFDVPISGPWSMPENEYYVWGQNQVFDGQIVSAQLDITNIFNSTWDENVLFVHLLGSATPGVQTGYDNDWWGTWEIDRFNSNPYDPTAPFDPTKIAAPFLVSWNIPGTPVNLSYSFDVTQLGYFNSFVGDGNFGLGFDPDCLYGNDDIKLTVTTRSNPVPEPCTMLLLGGGLLGLAGLKRRRG